MGLSIASDEAQKALSTGGGIEKKRALSESLVMGFSAHGRRIPESKLAADSPKRVAIEELRNEHPTSIPMWIEGKVGQKLELDLSHVVDLGNGANLTLGFTGKQGVEVEMNRLMFLDRTSSGLADAARQAGRLRPDPIDLGAGGVDGDEGEI